ncbi:uncharacterized protein LOC124720027 [Schistocerca piceifrons]|uniref:uncharacterized protein LOC124720027 n=1 Tax=Schistocerca piceifrons TaxID=274613 RepID=UPI001F5FE463|nr:uncharacterized protein LOC124720027 [Schistocerca piceifrons]
MEKWTNEKTLNFINAIHLRPELWDVESSVYKDRNLKKDSWLAVADDYGITPDEAYKKFRSLRTYAKCEEKKHRKSGSSGGSTSPWFAYDAMSFILSQDVPETGADSENATAETQFKTEFMLLDEESDMLEPEIQAVPLRHSYSVQKKGSHRDKLQEAVDKAVHIVHHTSRKRTNPSAAFGEHVANKLLRYSDLIRSEVEFKISEVLYKADMKMLRSESGQSATTFCPPSPEVVFSDGSN